MTIFKKLSKWLQKNVWDKLNGKNDKEDVIDEVVIDPEPIDPIIKPIDPEPQPPSEQTRPNVVDPSKLVIWCEASAAYDLGIKNATVMSLRGKAGSSNIRIAHPWYDPWKTKISYNEILQRVIAAKNEGCSAFAIDFEGWLISESVLNDFRTACDISGLPLIAVPKHSMDPGQNYPLTGNFDGEVKVLEKYCHASIGWLYSLDGPTYLEWNKKWRQAGYKGQIGCTQDTIRDGGGYIGKHVWLSVAQTCKNENIPFMLFLGNHSDQKDINTLKEIFN